MSYPAARMKVTKGATYNFFDKNHPKIPNPIVIIGITKRSEINGSIGSPSFNNFIFPLYRKFSFYSHQLNDFTIEALLYSKFALAI